MSRLSGVGSACTPHRIPQGAHAQCAAHAGRGCARLPALLPRLPTSPHLCVSCPQRGQPRGQPLLSLCPRLQCNVLCIPCMHGVTLDRVSRVGSRHCSPFGNMLRNHACRYQRMICEFYSAACTVARSPWPSLWPALPALSLARWPGRPASALFPLSRSASVLLQPPAPYALPPVPAFALPQAHFEARSVLQPGHSATKTPWLIPGTGCNESILCSNAAKEQSKCPLSDSTNQESFTGCGCSNGRDNDGTLDTAQYNHYMGASRLKPRAAIGQHMAAAAWQSAPWSLPARPPARVLGRLP